MARENKLRECENCMCWINPGIHWGDYEQCTYDFESGKPYFDKDFELGEYIPPCMCEDDLK